MTGRAVRMNRLNMTDEMKRRLLMTFGGVVIAGFSVGMFQFSLLGMDPFQVVRLPRVIVWTPG